MGRPSKFTAEARARILKCLKVGTTRKASAESAGVNYDTFLAWVKQGQECAEKADGGARLTAREAEFSEFHGAVLRAEADAAVQATAVLAKAAGGWDSKQVTRTVKSVESVKKTKYRDGTVVEEPIVLELVTETTIERREFDWRPALEFLKRRHREEWGDRQDVTSNGETIGAVQIYIPDNGRDSTPGDTA